MAISTIYEVSKPTYKFYAVERSGYTNVGTLVTDTVTDMTRDGKFSFKSSQLTDTFNFVMPTPEWPIKERLIKIAAPGVGYKIGNLLEVPLALGPNIKVVVSNVATLTGGISNISVYWPGNYNVPTVTSVLANFATDWLGPATANTNPTTSVQNTTASFVLSGNIVSSIGTAPAVPSPAAIADQTTWNTEYGSTGGGGTAGQKWPSTGIWFQSNITPGANTLGMFVGQLIELDPAAASTNSPTSVIPPGTKIVSILPMKYINGGLADRATGVITEKTADGCYFVLSQPVTLKRNDKIVLKGTEARISNNETQDPKAWTVIVEADGAIDPLNDSLGVQGDIRVSGTNSEYMEITSLTNPPGVPYLPRIHEGQAVYSTALNGSIGPGDMVYVSAVTMNTAGTIANVRLSRSLSNFTAGETLQFVFDQMQPWRMAFQVKENTTKPAVGPQEVVVYAATEIQLTDTGNIANIFLSNAAASTVTYAITDRSGIMGGLPTGSDATPAATDPTQGFINRAVRVNGDPSAYPFNYALTMTDRGIFWGVWEGTWSTMQKTKRVGAGGDSFFNWLLIQRPVNRNTGKVLTKGRAPVFCINSVGYRYWKFIVREEDVLHPTIGDPENKRQRWDFANSAIISDAIPYRVPADTNTQDSFAIMNTANQVALTEDSKYLVSFLHNLSTPRFRYSEELDMIGQTSADVCMAGTDISITAYGESSARTYRALPANNPYNTGLRIAVLRDIPQIEP